MLKAIDNASEYSNGLTKEQLSEDKMRFYAIVKNVEIVGEAAYMLSLDFKASHPDTPWRGIEGMRHYLVHGYYQVDDLKLWNTLHKDLGPLKRQIEEYLKESSL